MKYNSILLITIILLFIFLMIHSYFLNNQMNLKVIESFANPNSCINKNIDYGAVCVDTNNSKDYGVGTLQDCSSDATKKKYELTCANMTFNGVDYSDEGTYSTGCINHTLDMDTMCNSYMPVQMKANLKQNGYYNKSAGAQVILKGKEGDCYNNDGTSNPLKSRAICNLRSNKEINRILPGRDINESDKFTDCQNMENYNFLQDCKTMMSPLNETEEEDIYADIHGYDCMPGYARAKCYLKDEKSEMLSDLE